MSETSLDRLLNKINSSSESKDGKIDHGLHEQQQTGDEAERRIKHDASVNHVVVSNAYCSSGHVKHISKLEGGPMPNVMVALPNTGGALCSTPQSLADAHEMPCSNAAKTRNPLKFAAVPQITGSISAASGPKFTIL